MQQCWFGGSSAESGPCSGRSVLPHRSPRVATERGRSVAAVNRNDVGQATHHQWVAPQMVWPLLRVDCEGSFGQRCCTENSNVYWQLLRVGM